MGVIEVVNTVLWGWQKGTVRKMPSGLEIKDIFTSAAVRQAWKTHEKAQTEQSHKNAKGGSVH